MRFRSLVRLAALTLAALLVSLAWSTASAEARPASHTYATLGASTITLGGTVAIRSAVTPNQSGHSVFLQKHTAYGWVTLKHRYLNSASRFTFYLTPGSTGAKYLRVYFRATTQRSGSLSRTMVLHVRAKPSTGGGGGGGTGGGSCTPGYSPCIPVGSDVDCAGGSGNGPRYVNGPVYVTGSDPYGLDGDGDGVACES